MPFGSAKANYTADEVNLRLDTHDSANFPRDGYGLSASWQRVHDINPAGTAKRRRSLNADFATSRGPYTFFPSVTFVDAGPGGAVAVDCLARRKSPNQKEAAPHGQ